ncbi:MAG: hypothetical protein CVV27_06725, partial [Candidatus Melainabacteria bacterium HGW-Melainabacteria-1]
GSLIGLERAAAAGKKWGYAAPICSAAGGLSLLFGAPLLIAGSLFATSALIQFALLLPTLRAKWTERQALPLLLQLTGLLCWLIGSLIWVRGAAMPEVSLWWGGLLLLTIAGGRLDKFLPAGTGAGFALGSTAYIAGLGLVQLKVSPWGMHGLSLSGLGLMLCALWLLVYDPATRPGLSASDRFMAVCLWLGYGWLGVGGMSLLPGPAALQGLAYDMSLHSLFVGFVFALILGHLPRILPLLLQRPAVHHPLFYLPLGLLQAGLLLRLANVWFPLNSLRAWGGLLNEVAVLMAVLLVLWRIQAERQQHGQS